MVQDEFIIAAIEGVLTNFRMGDTRLIAVWAERLASAAYDAARPSSHAIRDTTSRPSPGNAEPTSGVRA